jgi:hypothetical protein
MSALAQPEKAPETPEAAGPSAADLEQAKGHFKKGKELFDAKDFENAVKEFKESYRLSKNPVLLYNIAFTLDEIGDKEMALFYYEKFLRDTDPEAANRSEAEERIKTLKAEAGGSTDSGEDASAIVSSFKHNVVEEAPPGKPLDITAVIPEGATWKVTLHYRPSGESKFTSVAMTPRYTELVGRIPADKTNAKSIQYYLEVQGPDGKVIERSGEPTSPHLIYMDEAAKARFYPDFDTSAPIPDDGPGDGGDDSSGGGFMDGSSTMNKIKWGTTIGAGVLVLSGTVFALVLAPGVETDLESESIDSRLGTCMEGPPCKAFSGSQKDLQTKGKRYQTIGNVSLIAGGIAAVGAGVLWYLDLTGKKSSSSDSSISAVPMVGNDFVGGAATLRF